MSIHGSGPGRIAAGAVAAAGLTATLLLSSTTGAASAGAVQAADAAATIAAPATGGASIGSTTARIGGNGSWTRLKGPVIAEAAVDRILPGSAVTLTLPGGFEWNMANTKPPAVTGCTRTATATVYASATVLSVTLVARSGASTKSTCRIDFGGLLQVRPIDASLIGSAGDVVAAVRTASGSTPLGGSAGFLAMVSSPIRGSLTLEVTSPGMRGGAIDWGTAVDLTTTGTSGQPFQIQVSADGIVWRTLRDGAGTPLSFTIGPDGTYTHVYTPVRDYRYRAIAGATTSEVRRVAVRQTISLRPSRGDTVTVSPGTAVTFAATVRPARPGAEKARVLFRLYRKIGASWVLARTATVAADAHGIARHAFTFGAGRWYVRARAQGTSANAASSWTPILRYAA